VSDDKPFILAGKETVLRAITDKLYESEINDLSTKRELLRTSEARSIDMQSLESTREGIHNFICEILGLKTLGGNDDIFAAGLDSLSVLRILASLRAAFQAAGKAHDDLSVVSTSTIYTSPRSRSSQTHSTKYFRPALLVLRQGMMNLSESSWRNTQRLYQKYKFLKTTMQLKMEFLSYSQAAQALRFLSARCTAVK
jgi:hypothetical protein